MFHVASLSGGGAEKVMVTLANAFAAKGENVMIYCRDHTPSAYPVGANVRLEYLQDHLPPFSGGLINRVVRKVIYNREYRKAIKTYRPDFNIVFTAPYAVLVLPILLKTGIPVICSEHSTVTRNYPDKKIPVKRKRLYPRVDAVTVLTHYDYALWCSKPNVVRMPNPFIPTNVPQVKREKIVIAAGRIREWKIKGFDNLIKSWSLLWKEFPDWKLVIAGKYDDKSLAFLKGIEKETRCKNIEFLGFCNNLEEIMSHCEVFCLSSRLEGLPMVLLEAMNAGCACVANDCITGPSEIIENGVNGLLASCDNIIDLSEKLRTVMKSSELRDTFRGNIHLSISQYSLETVLGLWYSLFDKILEKKK